MQRDPWFINMKDRMGREAFERMQGLSRKASIKCFNCQGYGHYKSECPNPEPPLRCHLCVEVGHEISSCHLKLCEFCLKEAHSGPCRVQCISDDVKCERCLRKGHISQVCSDIWRQFHNTIESNEILHPVNVKTQRRQRMVFCSNCASQGHFHFECHLLQPRFKPYAQLVTKYDYGTSETNSEHEVLHISTKRGSMPLNPGLSGLKRSRYEAEPSVVDSTMKRFRGGDMQGGGELRVSSGLGCSRTRNDLSIPPFSRSPYPNPPLVNESYMYSSFPISTHHQVAHDRIVNSHPPSDKNVGIRGTTSSGLHIQLPSDPRPPLLVPSRSVMPESKVAKSYSYSKR